VDTVESDLLAPVGGPRRLVRVRVGDSGPGIAADAMEHIFDPFFTRRAGGSGLGLALVQRAVEAHGGVVYIDETRPFHPTGAALTLCLPHFDAAEDSDSTPDRMEDRR
jgi:signal transduction histidine kinase